MIQVQKIDRCKADGVVDEWIIKWREGRLSHCDIQSYWYTRLPKVEYDPIYLRSKHDKDFIYTLEKFIFYGKSLDDVEMTCKQNENTTSCCKVLLNQESFYTCEDCKLTEYGKCGLCVECFQSSEHRWHRYKVRIGTGNEICCCGQVENWKNEAGCSRHLMSEDIEEFVPKDLISRAGIAIEAILRYNADLIDRKEFVREENCWDKDSYCAVLYSSESDTLRDILKRTTLEIEQIRNLEEESILIYRHGSKEYCENPSENKHIGKSTAVIHAHEAVRQNFALRLLECLEKILKYNRSFRKVFTELITKRLSLQECFIEKFFNKAWNKFSRKFRFCCYTLLVAGTLKEYENKQILAKEIVGVYKNLWNQCQIKTELNFFAFSRQLFSDPLISNYLIEKEFAITIFFKSLLENPAFSNLQKLRFRHNDYFNCSLSRSFAVFADVRMLLSSGPRTWTENLRKVFLDGLSYFLKILSKMHKLHVHVRETTDYVNCYLVVNTIFDTQRKFEKCGAYFLKWCRDDKEALLEAYKATLVILQNNFPDDFNQKTKTISLMNHSARCLPYQSETQSVSLCLFLTRFLAGLILLLESHGVTFNSVEVDTLKSVVVSVVDPVLKLQVMIAQGSAGLWKRNDNLVNEIVDLYWHFRFRTEILDRDIQVLQITASILDPNEFLIHVLDKYDLIGWMESNFEESLKSIDGEVVKELICISENFLQLVITVVAERHVFGIGCVTNRDCLKHQVIHELCMEPKTHSLLKQNFSQYTLGELDLDEIINEVAILETTESEFFQLREEFADQYNPLFYHYSAREMMQSREFQLECRKSAKQPEFLPPPKLPQLKQSFSTLVNIFQSDVLMHIMQVVIERAIDINSKSYSNRQLENVLYLIGFALLDEESGYYDFLSFAEKAAKWNIFNLLEKLLISPRSVLLKDLIMWIFKKYNSIAGVTTNTTPLEVSPKGLKKKNVLAAERRAKIMEKMAQKRKQFLQDNFVSDELDETETTEKMEEKTCILCQETQSIDLQNRPFIVLGNVQISSVLWTKRKNISEEINLPILSSSLGPAYFTSTCGHAMHLKCWKNYLKNNDDKDIICPLCHCINDFTLPLFPFVDRKDTEIFELRSETKMLLTTFARKFLKFECQNPLGIWKSLAYTIHAMETSMRDLNKPLLENFSNRNQSTLETLVRISAAANFIYPQEELHKSYITQIQLLLSGETNNLGTILDFDMFGLLVVMVLSKSDLVETLRMVFSAELVKILICSDFDGMTEERKENNCNQLSSIKQILKMVSKEAHHLSDDFIWTYVQEACVPFLRCCVLFYKFLDDTPSPTELTELGGDSFSNLCSYLGLPQKQEEIFGEQQFSVMKSWCIYPSVLDSLKCGKEIYSTAIPQLIELPDKYYELYSKVSSHNDQCGNDIMLCLICGKIICSRSSCMKVETNEICTQSYYYCHQAECSGVGLFLCLSGCWICGITPSKDDWTLSAPYVNKYNESGFCGWRESTYPLKFSPKIYKELHRDWLSHSIMDKINNLNHI